MSKFIVVATAFFGGEFRRQFVRLRGLNAKRPGARTHNYTRRNRGKREKKRENKKKKGSKNPLYSVKTAADNVIYRPDTVVILFIYLLLFVRPTAVGYSIFHIRPTPTRTKKKK